MNPAESEQQVPSQSPAATTQTLKRRLPRLSAAVLIGLALIGGVIWVLTKTLGNNEDPTFQGESLYHWAQQVNSPNPAASNRANALLTSVILPQLTETMFHDTNDSRLRVALVQKLNELPGVCIYFNQAEGRRVAAAARMGEFGPPAKGAIPSLIQAIEGHDRAVPGAAMKSLGRIRCQPDVVVPLLIRYLDDDQFKDEAIEALGDFGPQAKEALPKLLPLLKVHDKDLHHAVVQALNKIDPEAGAKGGGK